ncbi:MAG: hypothetical protein L6R39_007353 [Caloplaca ligustica]|nr:MAG: hypothetical protein L6R39_007353 [Caloplaca ligustica]
MPPSSWLPIYEVLARHGINHTATQNIAKNELRNWELEEVDALLKKVKVPMRGYCYFQLPFFKPPEEVFDFRTLWPSLWSGSKDSKWISPPRELMHRSVKEQAALCVNAKEEWSLRTSGYVALSHVWIEGLQRDNEHDGLPGEKFRAIFVLLNDRHVEAEWVWTDVLVIPGGDPAKASSADERLTIDIINTLPLIYSYADAVIILDALVLQLRSEDLTDVAAALVCGQWATRVWTFQEIKLAQRALVVTAIGSHDYSHIVRHLKNLADAQSNRYHSMYLRLAILEKNEARGLSIPDIVMACSTRRSGQDIDYARAFFVVLGLKWEYGMTREEGMQMIYRSQKRHAPRIACFYGAPRMKINLAWAPSYIHGLEGMVTDSLEWDDRGIRGEWYSVRIKTVLKKFPHSRRTALDLELDCPGDRTMQCVLAPNEDPDVVRAMEAAIQRGQTYVISLVPSVDVLNAEWARQALIVEGTDYGNDDGLEAEVYCASIITSRRRHEEDKRSILLLHSNPTHGIRWQNAFVRLFHMQKESSRPATLPRQDGESELHVAVRRGKLSDVIASVEGGASMVEFDDRGWTILHTAAARGETEILEYLLQSKPDLEVKGTQLDEDTPLALAARNGQARSIRILLSHGANIHVRDKYDHTPLMIAAYERHAEAVKELLSQGANPKDETNTGKTPLLLASGGGGPSYRLPTLRALVEGGAALDAAEKCGRSPLVSIAIFGSAEEMGLLLEQGYDPEEPEHGWLTPLCHAIQNKKADIVKVLIDAGANCNARFPGNWTPAHYGAKQPNWQIMHMLLQRGVDINVQTEPEGWTALHIALREQKSMTMPKLLIEAGADTNIRATDGKTPVQYLAANQDLLRTIPQLAAVPGRLTDVQPSIPNV